MLIILMLLILSLLFKLRNSDIEILNISKMNNSLFTLTRDRQLKLEILRGSYNNALKEIEGLQDLEIFLKEIIDEQDQCYKYVILKRNRQIRKLRKKVKINNEAMDDFLSDLFEDLE